MENLDNLNIIIEDSKLKNNDTISYNTISNNTISNNTISNNTISNNTLKKNIKTTVFKENKSIKTEDNDYKDILWLTAC